MRNGRGNGRVRAAGKERAVIAALRLPAQRRWEVEESLDELEGLAVGAGAAVVHRVLQERTAPMPALYFGRGKVDEIGQAARATRANLMICDDALTPVQERNLSQALGLKVIDRTALILDIFAQRARTSEGKLQVELAQLTYLLPRLVGQWTHLERLGGGIGTRGPGETQLESDRRVIRQRRDADPSRARARARAPARPAGRPPARRPARRRAGGLYERRQDHPAEPSHGGAAGGRRSALRDARPRGAPGQRRRSAALHPHRHRGIHPQAAARAGGRLSGHAGGAGRGRRARARGGCQPPRARGAHGARSRRCSTSSRSAIAQPCSCSTRSTGWRPARSWIVC